MGEKINCESALPNLDVGGLPGASDHAAHDFMAGGITQGVDNARMAMPPLGGEGDLAIGVVELHPHADQVADLLGCLLHHHANHCFIAKPVAGDQCVGHMILNTVFG